ncbi:MAG: SMC-Scp complex subunit ScpB [Nitrospirae bacterium]|nr:SMC-Scp complex subunit ScpB [Nitrospirota bacterium]
MDEKVIKAILESLLLVSGEPLSTERMREVLEAADKKTIDRLMSDLQKEYEGREGGIRVVQVAGGYQMVTPADHSLWVRRLKKSKTSQRLSKPSLETLAIIAYKQPVVKAEVDEIRGVDSSGVIKGLLDKRLIKIMGRMDAAGRPLMYGTTREFMQYFGLKDLTELPTLKEFEEMAQEEMIKPVEVPTGEEEGIPGSE